MKFMQFEPSVVRLRRLSKACRAGELSRYELRMERRDVIDKFAQLSKRNELSGAVTDVDLTQRRVEREVPEKFEAAEKKKPWWRVATFLTILGLLPLIVPLLAHGQNSQELSSKKAQQIPPLSQRDPNPMTAQRINVHSLIWHVPQGAEHLISQTQVDELLQQLLTDVQLKNQPAKHGFNDAELQEVGRFLNALGVHDSDRNLTLQDVADLQAVIQLQKQRRGVSVPQLEQIVLQLQTRVRDAGFLLATAYLPAQSVVDGQVHIGLEIGRLASVEVQHVNQQNVSDNDQIADRFANLLGEYVETERVATELNRLNQSTGTQVQGQFVATDTVGDSQLNLAVLEQRAWQGFVAFDNYGVERIGEQEVGAERIHLFAKFIPPGKKLDSLSLQLTSALDGGDVQSAKVDYTLPVFSNRYDLSNSLRVGKAENDSQVDLLALSSSLSHTYTYTRRIKRQSSLGLNYHEVDRRTEQFRGVANLLNETQQKATFLTLGFEGFQRWDTPKLEFSASSLLDLGQIKFDDGIRSTQSDLFYRLRFNSQLWQVSEDAYLPRLLNQPVTWVIGFNGQLAEVGRLPYSLRLSGAGAHIGKGLQAGSLLFDQGAVLSAQLRTELLQTKLDDAVWVFLDAGYGELHQIENNQKGWASASSFGLGWQASHTLDSGILSTKLTLGWPLSHRGSFGLEPDGTQFYWTLSYAPR